jgi:hypothetical protein
MISFRRALILAVLGIGAVGLAPAPQAALAAKPPVFTGIVKGVAVGGYDPVAYFTAGKATKGDAAITFEHQGVIWRFATAANRDAFKAEPAKYAPQYGGYCAWAVSQGYTAKGDPEAWTLHQGKLYLNYNQSVKRGWEKNIPGNVAKGDANWPKVLAK